MGALYLPGQPWHFMAGAEGYTNQLRSANFCIDEVRPVSQHLRLLRREWHALGDDHGWLFEKIQSGRSKLYIFRYVLQIAQTQFKVYRKSVQYQARHIAYRHFSRRH